MIDGEVRTMIYGLIVIGIIFIFVWFLTRHFILKQEINKVRKQLALYNKREADKKIDISLFDEDLENLVIEINKLIDLHVAENRKRVNLELEHKQAVANMSHDLRTPLTSIQGYIQMAVKDNISIEERKELLAIASERAKRLEALLRDFFELSVIESNDYELTIEKVNLRETTVEVLMSFYDRFQEKNLQPSINIPEKEVIVSADQSAVVRVLENLLSNAINHADGEVSIRLEEDANFAELIIQNNAFALTELDVDHLFDRYYMADQSRSRTSTGLGLSIVKSLMEKMNGSISAYLHDGELSIVCRWEKTHQN